MAPRTNRAGDQDRTGGTGGTRGNGRGGGNGSVVARLIADAELAAARTEAADELAGRLHAYACTNDACEVNGAPGLDDGAHWMRWSGPARAVLAGAHVHVHHRHDGHRSLIIQIDLTHPGKPHAAPDPNGQSAGESLGESGVAA